MCESKSISLVASVDLALVAVVLAYFHLVLAVAVVHQHYFHVVDFDFRHDFAAILDSGCCYGIVAVAAADCVVAARVKKMQIFIKPINICGHIKTYVFINIYSESKRKDFIFEDAKTETSES